MQKTATFREIPNFALGLYGDEHAWQTPDPFFYEAIRDRSKAYDWDIKPHRHASLYQYFFLTKGKFLVTIDGKQQEYASADIPKLAAHDGPRVSLRKEFRRSCPVCVEPGDGGHPVVGPGPFACP